MNTIFLKLESKKVLFIVLFIISFFIYLPAIDGRFTSDFYNWVNDYNHGDLSDLLLCFGYPGLHQLYHIPFYFSYKLFGLNPMAWHIEFTFLHALNAFLVYYLSKEFLSFVKKNTSFALLTSFLFLLSPFQTEVVAWGATIHYLFTLLLFLISFIFLIKFLKNKKSSNLFFFHFFYILDMFTMELPLVFPAIYFLFSIVTMSSYKVKLKTIISKILLGNFLTIIAYFLLTKLMIGSYIGHYGAKSHLTFDLGSSTNSLYSYFLKFLLFFRYIDSIELKNELVSFFHNDGFKIAFFCLLFFLFVKQYLTKVIKTHTTTSLIITNLMFFSISLIPVLNIEMSSLNELTTDRYSYVASVFFLIAITLIFSSFSKKIGFSLSLLYLLLNTFLLTGTINIWKETGVLANNIIDSFTFYNEDVYAINNIDLHRGAYLFKNGFVSAIELQKGKKIKNSYHEIAKVYSLTLNDSINISINNGKVTAEVLKWGRWFWLKTPNEKYSAHLGYLNQSVIIKPKEKIQLIYLKAGVWQKEIWNSEK